MIAYLLILFVPYLSIQQKTFTLPLFHSELNFQKLWRPYPILGEYYLNLGLGTPFQYTQFLLDSSIHVFSFFAIEIGFMGWIIRL